TLAVGARSNAQDDGLAAGAFEHAVQIVRRLDVPAIHRQQILAGLDIDARLRQRGTQVGVPVLAVIDLGETIATLVAGVVRPEQAAFWTLHLRLIAAEDVDMPQR